VSQQSDDFAAAAAQLTAALAASANDPADAIRMLLPLCTWTPAPVRGTGPLAVNAQAALDAIASTLRCAACAALAGASAAYQPLSYQDAMSLRDAVCGALDLEATLAADGGRDATYQALRTLRAAVALDLATRGADLALLVQIATPAPMPSLAEAWTLYQDTTREPGLVASAQPANPLFLPPQFEALNA
jgi:prophage DNA circulation protein